MEQCFDGAIWNQYNALFLETDDGISFRFVLDLGKFFRLAEPPRVWRSSGRNTYRLVEPEELRPLYGRAVIAASFNAIPGGGRELRLRFEGGGELRYWNEAVVSRLSVEAPNDT